LDIFKAAWIVSKYYNLNKPQIHFFFFLTKLILPWLRECMCNWSMMSGNNILARGGMLPEKEIVLGPSLRGWWSRRQKEEEAALPEGTMYVKRWLKGGGVFGGQHEVQRGKNKRWVWWVGCGQMGTTALGTSAFFWKGTWNHQVCFVFLS
jgi:hypothetical protein